MQGWISLHREILNNPIVCKDTDYFTVWVFLLLEATHTNQPKIFKGNKIVLKRGQLITGRKSIASRFNISESKVQRILKMFENEQQIEQQTSNKNRLVTVVNYNDYQNNEQQIEQSVNNKRTTNEQPVNTNNKDNKLNKENKVIKDTKKIIPKLKYLEFVLLTEDEHTKLKEKFNSRLDSQIENLNNYIGSTGKKYKSHYHTLLSWDRKNSNDNKQSISDEELNRKYGADND